MTFIKKHIGLIAGIAVGAVGGYLYYHYIGCMSGACPITSKPVNSTLYGALMGALLFGNFNQLKTKTDNQNQ